MRWPIHVQVALLVRQQHRSLTPLRLGQVFLRPATSPPPPPGWWVARQRELQMAARQRELQRQLDES